MGDSNCHIVYFVRHGESQGNITKTVLCPEEDILTENGKEQAGLAAKALSNIKFTKAYSSIYPRTAETARIILSQSKESANLELKLDARIREKSFGMYEGGPYRAPMTDFITKVLDTPETVVDSFFKWEIEQAETPTQIFDRCESFFKDLCDDLDKCTSPQIILVVSHAFLIQAFMRHLSTNEKIESKNWNAVGNRLMRNASYFQLAVGKNSGGKRLVDFLKLHETTHLSSLNDTDTLVAFAKSPLGQKYSFCIQT